MVSPRGRTTSLAVEDGRALFADTDEAGLYRVKAGEEHETSFAAAVIDEEETRIAPRSSLPTSAGVVAAQRFKLQGDSTTLPGRYLALYEVEHDDPPAVMQGLTNAAASGVMYISPAIDVAKTITSFYTPITGRVAKKTKAKKKAAKKVAKKKAAKKSVKMKAKRR